MRIIVTILLITFISCKQELPNRQELIDYYYNEKRDAILKRKKRDCIISAKKAAEVKVDSEIDKWINVKLFDTLNFPPKPVKPKAPDHIIDKVSKF